MTRVHAEQFRSRPSVTMADWWPGFDQAGGVIYYGTGAMPLSVLLQLPDAPPAVSSRDNLKWCWASPNMSMPAARTFFSLDSKPNVRFNAHIPVMERGLNLAMQMRTALAVGFAKLIGLDANEAADAIAASAGDDVGALHAEPLR
jgi:hypothetical protein